MNMQWKRLFIGAAAALTLTAGALWAMDTVSAASPATLFQQAGIQQIADFAGRRGPGGHGGQGGLGRPDSMALGHGLMGDQQQYLAAALGITVEELQAAQNTVRNTLIDQAVADGTITQEQADAIKAGERVRVPGLRVKGDLTGGTDQAALLADALGITVEQLETAQATARDAAIADALANGDITQEQVDYMAAHQALRTYLEETDGTERPDATMAELIQEAVTAGAITQEQADLLASGDGRMGPRGRRNFEGPGPGGQEMPSQTIPQTQPNLETDPTETTTDSNV